MTSNRAGGRTAAPARLPHSFPYCLLTILSSTTTEQKAGIMATQLVDRYRPETARESDIAHYAVGLLTFLQQHGRIVLMDYPFGEVPDPCGDTVSSYDIASAWANGQQFRIETDVEPRFYGPGEHSVARCYPLSK